jgi:Rrf2 family transcriptional regulator, nitric oxide-sensitive transcriptional repressor
MRLTLFTDYSLRVLLLLAARRDTLTTIAAISSFYAISEAHLMKVTHTLGRTGWVETVRGRHGGMRLVADPAALNLGDVVRELEGQFAWAECFTPQNTCHLAGRCGLETALAAAGDAFLNSLGQHTLASISRNTQLMPTSTAALGSDASAGAATLMRVPARRATHQLIAAQTLKRTARKR